MKKYTLSNYAETNATASSSTTDSGIIDSGFIDSGIVDSGLVDSGVVDPDDEEDPGDESTWDYGTYTEEEMEQMMKDGIWNGGYVNGVYVMPTVDIHPNNGGGGENISGGHTGGGHTGGGYTGDGNSDEQNNPVPALDEQSTNGDSTQSGTQGGGGTPGNSTEETNQTPTSPSNGIVMYVDNIPVFSYEYALAKFNQGIWQGGFVIGMDPNNPASIAYTPKSEFRPYGIASSGEELLQRAYEFEGVPYEPGGWSHDGVDCSGLVTVALGLSSKWATGMGDVPTMNKVTIQGAQDYDMFISQLLPGDVLLWNRHAAFYVSGNTLFHARRKGTLVGKTNDLKWWYNNHGVPKVYRK